MSTKTLRFKAEGFSFILLVAEGISRISRITVFLFYAKHAGACFELAIQT
jgi:hypothetical protein